MAVLSLTGVIIEPTTDAAIVHIDLTKGVYDPSTGGMRKLPATIELIGVLDTDEEILIMDPIVTDPDTEDIGDWQQYYYKDEAYKLTATNHTETIDAPCEFLISKPATDSAVGVRIV